MLWSFAVSISLCIVMHLYQLLASPSVICEQDYSESYGWICAFLKWVGFGTRRKIRILGLSVSASRNFRFYSKMAFSDPFALVFSAIPENWILVCKSTQCPQSSLFQSIFVELLVNLGRELYSQTVLFLLNYMSTLHHCGHHRQFLVCLLKITI